MVKYPYFLFFTHIHHTYLIFSAGIPTYVPFFSSISFTTTAPAPITLFSSIVIFSVCLFLSTFTHKTKKTLGISLGIVFASYFLNIISEIGESTEFLKYISIFTLADIRNVIINVSINPLMIVLTIGITAIFMILTVMHYEKKELV